VEAEQQVREAEAERAELEKAFLSQMEQAQRSLNDKVMESSRLQLEADALRQELADARRAQGAGAVASAPSGGDVAQLRQRIGAIEEEKQMMLEHMREHISRLAHENLELRRALGGSGATAEGGDLSAQDGPGDLPAPSRAEAGSSGGPLKYALSPFLSGSDQPEAQAQALTTGAHPKLVLT